MSRHCLTTSIQINKIMTMRPTDNNHKLVEAEFTILRRDDYPSPRIKVWTPSGLDGSWKTYEKDFASKAARDRRIDELKQDPKIIIDWL